ncbi:hypothetical protein [Alteromonas sp. RKMC-009]|uniref:hypothetical protein n=1 Tax=Alteromonas sp. RKMC-009 TaxID=2267264 RepID=UPI000E69707B|nr:hypothetical protein [Alteromonas sp. RKMC-009]AYA64710.1 hypothetical protein DS731_12225 [Alteromonas sp. RKMC-009]MEC7692081.1 hypothetical protein [Pseudomonadota bacterium]
MKTLISTLLLTLLSCSASAQEDDNVYFCQGVAEAVSSIQYGRAYGLKDEANDAVKYIASLSAEAEYDLLPYIDAFIRSSSPLPSAWTEILFTHACVYSYVDDTEQVKRISRQLPFQCDVNEPDIDCFNGVLERILDNRVI